MNSTLYLPRKLLTNDKILGEEELLAFSNYVIVLAEPGAGKTELLNSLASKLGTSSVTANVFRQIGAEQNDSALVIDAFDELAKIDQAGIHNLLASVRKAKPTHVIISSRSSEWGEVATNSFKDFLGFYPAIVRLSEFESNEQKIIFNHHIENESFEDFYRELDRFDLATLLPNPQFLKLFADAYVQSNRRFIDKKSIFSQAVERLAKEVNVNVARGTKSLSVTRKIELSSEVFAKLLLSGAEGVGTSEATEDLSYPFLVSLFVGETSADGILATRLFKPADRADHHRPVHKIVAEYCAASYLTKRIMDSADQLTLARCLAVIAPRSIVRDELRGLLGWMASLGNKSIEIAAIELDPYAVLANGDPSQLGQTSKRLLIKQLIEIERQDPYFRKGDFWRTFSVAGFFTKSVLDDIKPLLAIGSNGHLRDLVLELLAGSPAVESLKDELTELVVTSLVDENTRLLACQRLLEVEGHDYRTEFFSLVSAGDVISLKVAAKLIDSLGADMIERSHLKFFFQACVNLYPSWENRDGSTIGQHYFVKNLIHDLDLGTLTWLLDCLTADLICECGKESYACNCGHGVSKIVGEMLDRYFELAMPPFDPVQLWSWLESLYFQFSKGRDQSKAVQVIQDDEHLRQGIFAYVFGGMTDGEQIFNMKNTKFTWHSHSGLALTEVDNEFIVRLAYEKDNTTLWASFLSGHYRRKGGGSRDVNQLRRLMRSHASEKPEFMREWVKFNRAVTLSDLTHRLPRLRSPRSLRRRVRRQAETHLANLLYIHNNRVLIESGRHWRCLIRFAELVLEAPEKIEQEVGDESLVRNALSNCLDFISPEIPDMEKLAEVRCASRSLHSVTILHAACLEIMNEKKSLASVSPRLLKVLRTSINVSYTQFSEEQRNLLKSEIDKIIFPNSESVESFIRQYLEPQLKNSGCLHADIWLLRGDESFSQVRGVLSIDWLRRFPNLHITKLSELFDIAATYGDREKLRAIISERCSDLMSRCPDRTNDEAIEQCRTFWFLRAFYFFDESWESYWDWLKDDKDVIFFLDERSGRFHYGEQIGWPKLDIVKVEAILVAFIHVWPKVDLPSHWGTGSPKGETAYRFLTEIIWSFNSTDSDQAVTILERLLAIPEFADVHNDLKSMYSGLIRKISLRGFEPPTPQEVVSLLDRGTVVTVEDLRQLVLQELKAFQKAIDGGEYNSADYFYEKGERLGEIRSTEIVAERLSLRLEPQGISITPEHQLKSANRSDFTVAKMIGGKRRLLVTEVKGQWHRELYSAASAQLYERYSIHPDAECQGIFLVIWFGPHEDVAGRKLHNIKTAEELKVSIETTLPAELNGLIDVFVLDVCKANS